MRTQSEIKKNNIRKANLLRESQSRTNRGRMASQFGLHEQCGTQLDMDGEYMGAPVGTEPMDMMMGNDMMIGGGQVDCPQCGGEGCSHCDDKGYHGMDMDLDMMMDDDDMPMDDEMMMFMMEKKNAKPDFLDLDGDGDTEEPMKKAAKDKMDEKSGCGGKRYNEGNCGGKRNYNEEDLDEAITGGGQTNYCCDSRKCPCDDPTHPNFDPMYPGHHGGKVTDYEKMDHKDRSKFDGRKSRVVGVDSNIEKQRMMKESYKAVSATPSKDGWGNNFNNILTESKQVNDITSLMNRMKKIIK
jgi:hypothetical protein